MRMNCLLLSGSITLLKVVEIEAAVRIKGLRSEQRRCRYPDEWLGDSIQ
ncbi:jg26364, partial [Pararge aegeria aegeria]